MRVPSPPQNRTTFIDQAPCGSMTVTSGMGTMNLPPQSADMAHLRDDLVLQVPGQDQDVVGLGLVDRLDRQDRNVHARREAAVLVGVAVDGEVEEVGADAAIVEQRVALARRAVAADRLALVLGRDQERQQPALGASHLLVERRVGRDVAEAEALARARAGRATRRARLAMPTAHARDRRAASRRGSAAPRRRSASGHGARQPLDRRSSEK